jgi:hypothetical protein
MLPMPAILISLQSNAGSPAIYSMQVSASKKDDLVITPEGPRPRNKVHHVRPGEALRQNEDGTFTIVPNTEPPEPKGKTRKRD